MARSSKGARNITVGGVAYYWRATGNDGWISIAIWPRDHQHAGIYCSLKYHEIWTEGVLPSGERCLRGSSQIIVTSRIVRRIIEYAVDQKGFDPAQSSRQLDLGPLDEVINLSDAERRPN